MKYPIGIQSFDRIIEDRGRICLCRLDRFGLQLGEGRFDILPQTSAPFRQEFSCFDIEELFPCQEGTFQGDEDRSDGEGLEGLSGVSY